MKILIVEDEHKTAQLLKELIELHADYNVVAICDSVEATVLYLQLHQHQLDVIFMDIQLSDGQSFEVFDKMTVNLPVIFCTSYNEFMLKAFQNNGIGYILKPFDEKAIHEAIHKVEELKNNFVKHSLGNLQELLNREKNYQTSFLIRFRDKIYPIAVAEIAFVCLGNDATYLYTFKGEKHPILKSLDDLEASLSPQQFYRINRQMIINRKAIKEIEPYFNQRMTVQLSIPTNEQALVPRLKVSAFLNWLENG